MILKVAVRRSVCLSLLVRIHREADTEQYSHLVSQYIISMLYRLSFRLTFRLTC